MTDFQKRDLSPLAVARRLLADHPVTCSFDRDTMRAAIERIDELEAGNARLREASPECQFGVGDVVVKAGGDTEFIGYVKSVYDLEPGRGLWRMDVMSIAPGSRRLIHLYPPRMFRHATAAEIGAIDAMTAIWEAAHG